MWNTMHEWLNALPVSEEIIKSALMSVLMIVAVVPGAAFCSRRIFAAIRFKH